MGKFGRQEGYTLIDTLVVVADRVSVALALAREREALRERAALFTRLAAFGFAINASLDVTTAHSRIVAAVAEALQADIVTLVVRDPGSGEDRIVAVRRSLPTAWPVPPPLQVARSRCPAV